MLSKHHLYLLTLALLACLCIPQSLLAQSSLYQDAKLISEFLTASQPPVLVFKLAPGADPTVATNFGERRELNQLSVFRLPGPDYYRFSTNRPDPEHQLELRLVDTTIVFAPFDSIEVYYWGDYLGVSYMVEDSLVDIELPTWHQDPRFIGVEQVLAYHTDFDRLSKPGYRFSPEQSLAEYQSNPFLPPALRSSPILKDLSLSPDVISAFPANYYNSYPWQRLLDGDSTLQLKQSISFEEVSTSYRKPIVTSRRALDVSSDRINETSRNRGLLDARTVATGLSDFIAERAQEELNLTFFNRFKQNLDRPSELTLLFPSTRDLLRKFEISNYKTLLAHARGAFEQDLDNLGINFPKILSLDKYQALNNDPNVFNLSLIYSIADLAYKEYPVETILMSAHQILQERQHNLQQSIHQQLADTLSALNNVPLVSDAKTKALGASYLDLPSQRLTYRELLDSMRTYTLSYLDSVAAVSYELENLSSYELSPIMDAEVESIIQADSETLEVGGSLNQLAERAYYQTQDMQQTFYESYRYMELVGYQQGKNIEYQNRELDPYYTHFDHYRNVIPAHLSGQEYYGYILDQPQRGDHAQFFLSNPVPTTELIAQGMDEVELLLQREYAPKMEAFHEIVSEYLSVVRGYRTERELFVTEGEQVRLQAVDFDQRFQLLASAIDREIAYWQMITGLDESNHYIAGLQFLRNYLHSTNSSQVNDGDQSGGTGKDQVKTDNRNIWRIRQLAYELTAYPEGYQEVISQPHFELLDGNFPTELTQAQERMDFIVEGLEKQTTILQKAFGGQAVSQDQLMRCEAQADAREAGQKLQEEEHFLGQVESAARVHFVELPMSTMLENNEEWQRLQEEYYLRIEEWRFMEEGPEADSLSTIINEGSERMNEIYEEQEQKMQATYDQWAGEFELTKRYDQMEQRRLLIDSLFNLSMQESDELSVQTESVFVRDSYTLDNNTSLSTYRGALDNQEEPDLVFADLDELDNRLLVLGERVRSVQQAEKGLNQLLDSLELAFSPKLHRAKENAVYLAKSIELSAHLLFAFRDYERQYDTLFYQDSSYIEVTNIRLDSITGLTESFRYDSLQVTRRPVPGTTKPVTEARWLTREEFNELRTDEVQWNIFLSLLYQRLNSVEGGPNFSPGGISLLATKFLQIANDVEINLNDLRRKKAETPDDVKFKDYYPFIRSTVDLFNTILVSPSVTSPSAPTQLVSFVDQSPAYQPLALIPQISNEALSMYENIYVKDYGSAVLNAMELLKLITGSELDKKGRAQSGRAINAVLTYGSFMANMINAESSDQVKNILQAATLPPGSSRIKREVTSNFTINSYLGAAVGQDRLLNAPEGLDDAAFGAALAVPIGMTYSFSPGFIKNSSSFSLHIPLLDLGAITAYRQSPNNSVFTVNQLPEFGWENLFSPGLFAVYNFANSPFSLGVGGQYGPQLREIQVGTSEPLFVDSWRFPMVFFTVDVPFFNLHTGPKKIVVK